MLVELRIANYRSIFEEQIFSMVASKDRKHPDNLIAFDGFHLLKATGIYGSNAAGKSNLIKAIQFLQYMVITSATHMNAGDPITGAVPFRLSTETLKQPSRVEITFIADQVAYKYGFTATRERVQEEWLRSYAPDGTEQPWFDRRFNPHTNNTVWVFDGPLSQDRELLRERTRDNSLALSTGPRENVKPLGVIYQWFRRNLRIFDLSEPLDGLRYHGAELYGEDRDYRPRVARLLADADFQIEGFTLAPPDSPQRNAQPLTVKTQHHMIDSDNLVAFELDEESNGTQRFFAIAAPFLHALDTGAVMIVDELDCSLHPNLTRKLIQLFQSPEANAHGAQLIFTTHDATLLDQRLFRRDQMFLVEKRRNHGSEYFSLYDFDNKDRPRNTEAFQRNYLSGRYGAVPQFGPTFEDLQTK
jgi:AAA15 family ATPase/GTPase